MKPVYKEYICGHPSTEVAGTEEEYYFRIPFLCDSCFEEERRKENEFWRSEARELHYAAEYNERLKSWWL